jgi:hypothetical protein
MWPTSLLTLTFIHIFEFIVFSAAAFTAYDLTRIIVYNEVLEVYRESGDPCSTVGWETKSKLKAASKSVAHSTYRQLLSYP